MRSAIPISEDARGEGWTGGTVDETAGAVSGGIVHQLGRILYMLLHFVLRRRFTIINTASTARVDFFHFSRPRCRYARNGFKSGEHGVVPASLEAKGKISKTRSRITITKPEAIRDKVPDALKAESKSKSCSHSPNILHKLRTQLKGSG